MNSPKDAAIKLVIMTIFITLIGVGAFFLARRVGIIGSEPEDSYSVVFVIGARQNSRTINFADNPDLDTRINRVVNAYGYAAIVVADGMPSNQTAFFDFADLRPSRVSRIVDSGAVNQTLARAQHQLRVELQAARAESPEADILHAIYLAARILSSRPEHEDREIIVMGTGLSTAGWLNFADDNEWLYSDATAVVDMLHRIGNLPDLEGITVTWFQMFDVAEPQENLPGPQRTNLEGVWRMIALDSGAAGFNMSLAPPGDDIYHSQFYPYGLPHVSTVPIRPVVTSIDIHPTQATVEKGSSFTFSGRASGIFGDDSSAPADLDWDIPGEAHPGTIIANGVLYVAHDDPRESITVTATSTIDPTIYATATITLSAMPVAPGIPEYVVVNPTEITLETETPHNTIIINVQVGGAGNPSQAFVLELFGNTDPNTRVYQDGRIVIAAGETALVITLRASSAVDPHIFVEIPIKIHRPPDVVEVRFVGNSAEFANRADAVNAVSEWVAFIEAQDSGIYLFGCTADTGFGGDGISLSQSRANAVRDLFVNEFNIDPSKVIARGLGHNNPWNRPNGISGTASWREDIAASNRRVVIMSADDEIAQQIYNGTWR
ncbi:MAG: OmpA family protein [Defluviitaleaceae bacterium]|nr:OmpA family protein [Defluviitaleaceae bacterium]